MRRCGVITRFNLSAVWLLAALAGGHTVLVGCATVPKPASGDKAAVFALSARVIVRPDNAAAARFTIIWHRTENNGAEDSVKITDQFGVTRAELSRTPRQTTIRIDGKQYAGDNAEELSEKIFGIALPVEAFGYWVIGAPAPGASAKIVKNTAGDIAEILQFNWRVFYSRRDQFGRPQEIALTAPAATINFKISAWLTP